MVQLLGQPPVSGLTGAGETSIRRYAAGERTPVEVLTEGWQPDDVPV